MTNEESLRNRLRKVQAAARRLHRENIRRELEVLHWIDLYLDRGEEIERFKDRMAEAGILDETR